jgi:opacity protein-like surface antigen
MVSLTFRLRATVLTTVVGAFLSNAAQAADMPFFSGDPEPVNEGMVEWGTGWYLRGDVGAAYIRPNDLNGVILSPDFPNNWTAGLGGGYQYNSWFRTDVTVDYQSLYKADGPQYHVLPCTVGAVGTPAGGPFTGETLIPGACSPLVHNRTESTTVLANAYFDLGKWWGFTPYVGAGVGVNILYQKAQVNWYQGNLVPYAGLTWTDPLTGATIAPNWDRVYSGTLLRFAYGFMGGVAYDLTDHIKIDLGYRWLNLGKIDGVDSFNNTISKDIINQQARIGFRYVID